MVCTGGDGTDNKRGRPAWNWVSHRDSIYNLTMARKPKIRLKCPTCKQRVESAGQDFPFCSERCRLIDLGKWASGQYVVASPLRDTSDEAITRSIPGNDDED
jgi:uncharacterized protein